MDFHKWNVLWPQENNFYMFLVSDEIRGVVGFAADSHWFGLSVTMTVDREATSRHNETNASMIGQSSES